MNKTQANKLKILDLVEELLFCWFRYHLPRGKRKQLVNILKIISSTESKILFPIHGTNYMIAFNPSSANSAILCIRRNVRLKTPDKRLAFMKSTLDQAQQKSSNQHLCLINSILTPDSLTFKMSIE